MGPEQGAEEVQSGSANSPNPWAAHSDEADWRSLGCQNWTWCQDGPHKPSTQAQHSQGMAVVEMENSTVHPPSES